ncbi:MAG: TIGR03960 family B12-binding radical SAM protein [Planctomycetaceae bacterium]|nr:TIGR03960 family B12-binding radical SAM protein [Planctomycetaceae bacterium]
MPQSLYPAIERVALRVSSPAQYTGGEVNSVSHDWSDGRRVRFALAFPDTYAIGMSNQGFKILYHLVNDQPDMLCERAFAPWFDMEAIMRERQIPAFSLEHHYALSAFDAFGFSLQNETSYTNVLNIIGLSGIPIEARERTCEHPIVIAGGTGAVTPEPIADFVDLFFLGEGEEILPCFLRLLGAWRGRLTVDELRERMNPFAGKDNRKDLHAKPPLGVRMDLIPANLPELLRCEFIELCATVLPGCYAPSLYDVQYDQRGVIASLKPLRPNIPARVKKSSVSNLNDAYYPVKQILPYIETVHDRVTIEIMRGCTEGCRYCQAGMIDRPQRYRTPETVKKMARAIVRNTGYDEIALLSLSSSDHPQLFDMMDKLRDEFKGEQVSLSLPSLRVNDQLQKLPSVSKDVRRSGLTMAPETGSERLRKVINKNITQQDLINGAEMAFREGWRTIKFYCMIGLPTENDDDIRETAELLNDIAYRAKQRGSRITINVTVSLFVPKAFTPFQWEPMATQEELEHRRKLLLSLIQFRSIKLKFHGYGESWLEALLSRGDRRLGRAVKRAWELGARFDAWGEGFKREIWDKALAESGLDPVFYIHRPRTKDEVLPWDMLSVGINKQTLWDERVRSRMEQFTQDCSGHTPGCLACGVDPLTCRTGIDQPADEMTPEQQKRSRVRYAPEFKGRQGQKDELVAAAQRFELG